MQSRLIVKNFGPIKSVDLTLKNTNVFIGPQATGKSALAKIYTIFKAPRRFLNIPENESFEIIINSDSFFKAALEEYNISSFLRQDSEIDFDSELHRLRFKEATLIYEPKLLNRIKDINRLKENCFTNKSLLQEAIEKLDHNFIFFGFELRDILANEGEKLNYSHNLRDLKKFTDLDESSLNQIIDLLKKTEETLSSNTALYIPSERSFIQIIKNASLNLMLNNVPIPKHILSFGAELEKTNVSEIDLSFLQKGLKYVSKNGEDRIFTDPVHSIKLEEAASGIQSVLPILIPTIHRRMLLRHRSFVIEEPELNLFPGAQYKLIKTLESGRYEPLWEDFGSIHTYTTHSPYILSALNNSLYAFNIHMKLMDLLGPQNEERASISTKLVEKIIPAQINPKNFTAYQISNGTASSIFDEEKGLIIDNYIDEASDELADDFEALTELLESHK